MVGGLVFLLFVLGWASITMGSSEGDDEMHLTRVSLQISDMELQLLIKMHRRGQNNSLLRTSRPTKHAWLTDDQYRRAQCGQTDTASDQHNNDSQAAVTLPGAASKTALRRKPGFFEKSRGSGYHLTPRTRCSMAVRQRYDEVGVARFEASLRRRHAHPASPPRSCSCWANGTDRLLCQCRKK